MGAPIGSGSGTGSESGFRIQNQAEFSKIVPASSRMKTLVTGREFVEGPVWSHEEGGNLIFSDIPADTLYRWCGTHGLSTFRKPSRHSNGNTRDSDNRLLTCEHGSRTVSRTEPDGSVRTLAERYNGKRLNSPNDLVVHSDGHIWFTDPPYGIDAARDREQNANFVFRLDPRSGQLDAVTDILEMPNGLCFSPDEKKLYVADSGSPHQIRVFTVHPNGTLEGGEIFCVIDQGVPDGIRCDAEGRLYSTAGDGVQIFSAEGELIGRILTPEVAANLCFGGPAGTTLFITATSSVHAIDLAVRGAAH
jgi:gluconolactonase